MNKVVLSKAPILASQAWRVSIGDGDKNLSSELFVWESPCLAATAQQVEIDAALADSGSVDDTSIVIIWLPTGEAVPADLEKRVEWWISQGWQHGPKVRADVRTNRIVWAGTRALIYSAADQWSDTLDAVLRFTMMARATSALENQMRSIGAALNKHTSLSHDVSLRQVHHQPAVNRMTETVTRMRMSYLHLQSAIEQTDLNLGSASKRLCAELILQAALHDRLDVLDEPIQFALDHYELVNTRLIERKNASIEIVLTGLITLALFIQTIVILMQELK